MSIYNVNYLCREVMRDPRFRAALRANPAEALSTIELSTEERHALVAGDVAGLYRLGANSFLMGYLARYEVFGLSIATYGERMRKADRLSGAH